MFPFHCLMLRIRLGLASIIFCSRIRAGSSILGVLLTAAKSGCTSASLVDDYINILCAIILNNIGQTISNNKNNKTNIYIYGHVEKWTHINRHIDINRPCSRKMLTKEYNQS